MKLKTLLYLLGLMLVTAFSSISPLHAYTSTHNPPPPASAPDSYIIKFPDQNLHKRLNELIGMTTNTTRGALQDITVADAKKLIAAQQYQKSLNGSQIEDLEGIQYFTEIRYGLYAVKVAPTGKSLRIDPIKALDQKLIYLNLEGNNIDQESFERTIPSLTNLTQLIILNNKAENLNFIENLTKLTDFRASDNPEIKDFSPIWNSLSNLKKLELDRLPHLKQTDLPQIATLPLTHLTIRGNQFHDLSNLASLALNELYAKEQTITIDTATEIFPNPIKGIDGNIIPIIETATIKNVDASGNLNTN